MTKKKNGQFQCQIWHQGKSRYVGIYPSAEDASIAYKIAVEVLSNNTSKSQNIVNSKLMIPVREKIETKLKKQEISNSDVESVVAGWESGNHLLSRTTTFTSDTVPASIHKNQEIGNSEVESVVAGRESGNHLLSRTTKFTSDTVPARIKFTSDTVPARIHKNQEISNSEVESVVAGQESGNHLLSRTTMFTSDTVPARMKSNHPLARFNKKHDFIHSEIDFVVARREKGNHLLSRTTTFTSECRIKLYYPLYSGWSFPSMPHCFLTPGEACSWTLSRFKRDGLSNIWGDGVYPEFVQFVGVIVTDTSSYQDCTETVHLSSQIEREFFQGCKFLHLINMKNCTTSYERIKPTEFKILSDDLFRSRVDYQLSTNSVYQKSVTALSRSINKTYYEVNNRLRVMQESSPDHIIRLEVMCKEMKDHTFDNVEEIVGFLSRYTTLTNFDRIVVSVCAGMAETELHSDEMCICLDVDKRSLYSAFFAMKFLHQKQNNRLVFHRHDMSNGLYALLKQLRNSTALPLVVLFQHPSPTMNQYKLSIASHDCFRALTDNVVQSVHYVYDRHPNPSKNFWKYNSLFGTIKAQCTPQSLDHILFSQERTISEIGDHHVQHPVFGQVPRVGWAALKKGIEVSFYVVKKLSRCPTT